MLVLTRRVGEALVLDVAGHRIVVRVIDVHRGNVRLGCDAEREVQIYREEHLAKGPWRGVASE